LRLIQAASLGLTTKKSGATGSWGRTGRRWDYPRTWHVVSLHVVSLWNQSPEKLRAGERAPAFPAGCFPSCLAVRGRLSVNGSGALKNSWFLRASWSLGEGVSNSHVRRSNAGLPIVQHCSTRPRRAPKTANLTLPTRLLSRVRSHQKLVELQPSAIRVVLSEYLFGRSSSKGCHSTQ
jgi:hypothetical protein